MYEDKIVEVDKFIHSIAVEQEPVAVYQDKVVPVETVRGQIIPAPTVV